MQRIDIITKDLRDKILESLYRDEIHNAILIELIQNNINNLGELYVNEDEEGNIDILHIKNDGNSDFTNFLCTTDGGLDNIACKIKQSNYKKILLAGKLEEVNNLLKTLGYEKSVTPNIIFKLDTKKYRNLNMRFISKVRLASFSSQDLEIVKQFTARFLEVETEEEYKDVSEKIVDKLKNGIYLLEYESNPIGMARFIAKTNNFAEITSVYIEESYRNRGLGKELIGHMIETAIHENKIPVLATSVSNVAAMKTYEYMGFERQGEYAFEFLD